MKTLKNKMEKQENNKEQRSKKSKLVGIVKNIVIPVIGAAAALGIYSLIPEGIKDPNPYAQMLAKISTATIGALIWPAYKFCKKPKFPEYLNQLNDGVNN